AFAQQLLLDLGEARPVPLPFRRLADPRRLYRRYLVFRAVGRPVGTVRGDHVGARFREVEGGVDHAGGDAVGDHGAQHGFAGAALHADPVAFGDAAVLGVLRVDFEQVLAMPHDVGRA